MNRATEKKLKTKYSVNNRSTSKSKKNPTQSDLTELIKKHKEKEAE